jgi:thiosulfate/3-mercaptopyruvate sulfurtransferase
MRRVSDKGPLIEADDLARRVGEVTVLDVRWELGGPPGREAYLAGHIPGAVFVDLETELAGPPGDGGRHPLPDPKAFEAAMRRAGVSGRWPVVVYGGMGAARAWWLLRYYGHPDVRVLNGAWPYELERGEVRIEGGDFVALGGRLPLLDADGAAEMAARGVLLDARAPERFRGEQEPIDPVAGHIPGAVNLPSTEVVDGQGRYRRPEIQGDELGVYCGSGVSAAQVVLALAAAGRPAALYVGSWSEWITDPNRPVARFD